jgi:hypothetical protein
LNVREADLRESRVVTGNVPVVPTRESLHTGAQSRLGEGGLQPRNTDRFFTRKQPPAAAPAFHEQVNQVQRVMQGRIGNAQIPNTSGGKTPMGNTPVGKQEPAVGGNRGAEINSQRNQPGPGRDAGNESRGVGGRGNAERSAEPAAGDRGGWTKFGSPSTRVNDSGRSGNAGPSRSSGPASRDNVMIPGGSKAPGGRSNSGPGATTTAPSNEDRGGFRRFPADGSASPSESTPRGESPKGSGPVDRERGDRGVDRNNGGWQRFPSNSGPGSREDNGRQNDNPGGRDRSSGPRSKPILELNKPIVTPRGTPGPSPSRGPDIRNERSGPPPSMSRGEEPRGGPRERGSVGGASERGGGGGYGRSTGGGGGERGGGRERGGGGHERGSSGGGGERGSKSGSNPRNR